jgi:hypothetical protein
VRKQPRSAAALRNGGFALWLSSSSLRAEHGGEQLVEHDVAVAADRSLVARRPEVADCDGGRGRFLVGDDRVARAGMSGTSKRAAAARRRRRERREMLA